jgi:methylenetetrahydrofolate reductase (NADPH)
VENLYERLERMSLMKPFWIDVTWGAGGSTSKLTLEICQTAQNFVGLETMMHLTCTNMPISEFKDALTKAKENGIRNILALRGDPPRGEEWKQIEGGFAHAVDLVRYIRQEYGNYFGICVAGYPEGHIDAVSYEDDLKHLKEKVDAGADFIITQLFYDCNLFLKFVQDCRKIGITCPIIPGIMPIHGYSGFVRMTTLCKTYVPQEIKDRLEPIKNDDEAVKEYGVELAIQMCKTLLEAGTPGLHFYTLNLEKSVHQILVGLGLCEKDLRRQLPWQRTITREKEEVRPIFWSNRPQSYIHRTSSWDEFPNGRWGDSRSPAFGDLTDYHLMSLHATKGFDKKEAWGRNPKVVQEIYDVFAKFCNGEIEKLPWWDTPLSPETDIIKETLIKINKHGFLTINSQPAVNGAKSTDEKFGWGPSGGYVYQKAYIEFFTSEENLKSLIEVSPLFPDLTYHAINVKGKSLTNSPTSRATAVTWGVFPGREIIQPTIVDPESFIVWKDEAYALWNSQWGSLYEEGSESRNLINQIINTYYLVNIVDNNYINGDIFAIFNYLIDKKTANLHHQDNKN